MVKILTSLISAAVAIRVIVFLANTPYDQNILQDDILESGKSKVSLFQKWVFQPSNLSPAAAESTLDFIRPMNAEPLPMTKQDARVAANLFNSASSPTILLHDIFRRRTPNTRLSWFFFNLVSDLATGLALYVIAKELLAWQKNASYNLHTIQLHLEKSSCTKHANDQTRPIIAKETDFEDKSRKVGIPEHNAVQPTVNEDNMCSGELPNPILTSGLYLLHPGTIYGCACAPGAGVLGLACVLTAIALTMSLKINTKVYAGILAIAASSNVSLNSLALVFPIAGILSAQTGMKVAATTPTRQELVKFVSLASKILFQAVLFLILISFLAHIPTGLSRVNDWPTDVFQYISRQFAFEDTTPNSGPYWLLLIALFSFARKTFLTIIHLHVLIHAIPLTFRCWRFMQVMMPLFGAMSIMFEGKPSFQTWPAVIALLTIMPTIIYRNQLGLILILVAHGGWAMLHGSLDLWLRYDIANSTVVNTCSVVPFALLGKKFIRIIFCSVCTWGQFIRSHKSAF